MNCLLWKETYHESKILTLLQKFKIRAKIKRERVIGVNTHFIINNEFRYNRHAHVQSVIPHTILKAENMSADDC